MQEQVLGVIAADGTAIIFPVVSAVLTLAEGTDVSAGDVHLENDGGGLRAVDDIGRELTAHQAFWFAWSQFHPTTAVWSP